MPFSPKPPINSLTRQCGLSETARITLGGVEFVPDLSGALYVPEQRLLLVADLHLEKASNMARRGVHLPPYDTRASLALLEAVIANCKAERLIFLGDSFHDDEAVARIDAEDLQRLQAITSRVETIWITGNHDPNPPAEAGGRIVSEVLLGDIVLRHEPTSVAEGALSDCRASAPCCRHQPARATHSLQMLYRQWATHHHAGFRQLHRLVEYIGRALCTAVSRQRISCVDAGGKGRAPVARSARQLTG